MCTYILYHDALSQTPLVVASTRDDSPERPTSEPFLWDKQEYFTDYTRSGELHLNFAQAGEAQRYVDAQIIASQDQKSGGTFLGKNKHGLFAAINNRKNNIPFSDRFTRGGMVLDALTFSSAQEAVQTLYPLLAQVQQGQGRKYPCFNLMVADDKDAYILTNAKKGDVKLDNGSVLQHVDAGDFTVALVKVPERTISMVGGYDVNDIEKSARTRKFLPVYNELPLPQPGDAAMWGSWLAPMVHRCEEGSPQDYSICQPNPRLPGSAGKGDANWATIGTNLLTTHKTPNGIEYDWLSMNAHPCQGRMQAVKVAPQGNTPVELYLNDTQLSLRTRPLAAVAGKAV